MATKKKAAEKVPAEKKRGEHWVKVEPVGDSGSARYESNGLSVHCTPDRPAKVTLGEWESILKDTGAFELVKN